MKPFRLLLATIFVAILGYTAVVVQNHGLGLLAVFFADMATMGWPGQFNLDFMCMLALSGLWVAWRHGFGGALFLSAYLLVESYRCGGDVEKLLLGQRRARA